MEREIKFRGIYNYDFIYGYYVADQKEHHRIYLRPFEGATSNTYYFVKPETVGQFTGLLDRNGKEIYEGDIVTASSSLEYIGKKVTGLIKYNTHAGSFAIEMKEFGVIICNVYDIEVIGNIHQNPELL